MTEFVAYHHSSSSPCSPSKMLSTNVSCHDSAFDSMNDCNCESSASDPLHLQQHHHDVAKLTADYNSFPKELGKSDKPPSSSTFSEYHRLYQKPPMAATTGSIATKMANPKRSILYNKSREVSPLLPFECKTIPDESFAPLSPSKIPQIQTGELSPSSLAKFAPALPPRVVPTKKSWSHPDPTSIGGHHQGDGQGQPGRPVSYLEVNNNIAPSTASSSNHLDGRQHNSPSLSVKTMATSRASTTTAASQLRTSRSFTSTASHSKCTNLAKSNSSSTSGRNGDDHDGTNSTMVNISGQRPIVTGECARHHWGNGPSHAFALFYRKKFFFFMIS